MKTPSQKLLSIAIFTSLAALSLSACNKTPEEVRTATPVATTTPGAVIDDSVITTKVKSALLADPAVKSFDIKVDTRKGVVQMTGFIDNQAGIDAAVALAGKVEGVKSVDNGMTVKAGDTTVGNSVDDSVITTKVKSALLGDANVKSVDIGVVTRKGEVLLSGFVDSQSQIDQAAAVARGVAGVTSVRNELNVKK